MLPFDLLFWETARKESLAVQLPGGPRPTDVYIFREFYCNEPRCDCRRVILQISSAETRRVVASLNYAFEPPGPPFEDEPQLFVDPLNPQSSMADGFLELFSRMIQEDPSRRERLIEHYERWKRVVDDPAHPDHSKVRSPSHDDPGFRPAFPGPEPLRRSGPRVGPNDPCPCGSGRKYKKCCGG